MSELLERDGTRAGYGDHRASAHAGLRWAITTVKDYRQAVRMEARNRRTYVRMDLAKEPRT